MKIDCLKANKFNKKEFAIFFFSAAFEEACETFIFRHTVFHILYIINTYRYRILA